MYSLTYVARGDRPSGESWRRAGCAALVDRLYIRGEEFNECARLVIRLGASLLWLGFLVLGRFLLSLLFFLTMTTMPNPAVTVALSSRVVLVCEKGFLPPTPMDKKIPGNFGGLRVMPRFKHPINVDRLVGGGISSQKNGGRHCQLKEAPSFNNAVPIVLYGGPTDGVMQEWV